MTKQTQNVSPRKKRLKGNTKWCLQIPEELSRGGKDRAVLWEPIRLSWGTLENDISSKRNNLPTASVPGRKRKESVRADSSASWKQPCGNSGNMANSGLVGGGAGGSPTSRAPLFYCFLSSGMENWCQSLTYRETSNYNYKFTFQIKSHKFSEIEPNWF